MPKLKRYTAALPVMAFLLGLLAVLARAFASPADYAPVIAYVPVLPENAPEAQPFLVPVASNHPLDGDHKGMTRAILVVHDAGRDAGDALSAVMALAGAANAGTMIVAPQFLIESDLAFFAERLPDHGKAFARWPLGQWEQGGDSTTLSTQKGISSFTAVDLLLLYLGDKKLFPDLGQIVIAGQGSGADLVLRYAASGHAPNVLDNEGYMLRFVAADPSSYLYFTASRPRAGKTGFAVPDAAACPDFNAWPYGLDRLNPYVARTGANAIKLTAPARHVTYLISTLPGAGGDPGCAAMQQGADRASRATNYDLYLSLMYGDARKAQYFAPPLKNGGTIALYGSACGMTQLFGTGDCTLSLRNAKSPQ